METLICSYIANVLLLCSLIIFATMLSKGMCSLRMQCNERDHYLLLNFKHIVVDPSNILSTWSDERDCCQWEGVQCDNTTGRVIKLILPCPLQPYSTDCGEKKSHCLTGEFHLSLFQLEFLNYLDLSNHDFHAIIQNDCMDITNCNNLSVVEHQNTSNLRYLDLSYNEDLHFDSLNWLSHVSLLKYVDFSGINLQGRVDWHQLTISLPFLLELHLDGCQLSNISPSLPYANFTSLEVLSLSDNAFSSEFLPDWLFNLSNVITIDLSENYFQGQLPERLLNLKNIRSLNISNNEFTGPIPNWFGQLKHLQVLDVSDNSFSGPIPSTLGNISSLIFLDVSSNYLNDSLPKSLGQLFSLELLGLADNNLTGYVSERNFVKLSNLKNLYMGSPGLIFDFDSLWVPPFQLGVIHLYHIVGSKLPAWIYTQTSLSRLIITHSIISLEPQDKFWDFVAQVPYIRLQHNTIHGEMSNVLLNSTIINLSSNMIKGNLPRLSSNVMAFTVARNYFKGTLSPLLCQKMNGTSQLQFLSVCHNLLFGGLTNCWMYWKSLVIVRLDGNNLTGTIPPSISLLSNLMVLHLNKNNLFGDLPLGLKNCRKLQVLDMGENKFSGFLPNWIVNNTKILRLRSNQLSGNIPLQICQSASLGILDFADNKISGSIPHCLQNMTAMAFPPSSSNYNGVHMFCIRTPFMTYEIQDEVMVQTKGQESMYAENLMFLRGIDMSSNNISGSIPQEIFSLIGLQYLNLSHNQLEGNIPNEIGSLKNLESLDLAGNRLSGEIPQSMAELSFLGTLNLSFNNFTGKIPSGTQLQGFDPKSYTGNPQLCGPPLPKTCKNKEDKKSTEVNDSQVNEFLSYFYIGMGGGFVTAFWGVCVVIFFNKNFRHSYFRFLYHIRDKLYVIVVFRMNRFH